MTSLNEPLAMVSHDYLIQTTNRFSIIFGKDSSVHHGYHDDDHVIACLTIWSRYPIKTTTFQWLRWVCVSLYCHSLPTPSLWSGAKKISSVYGNLWEISYLAIKLLSDSFNGNAETQNTTWRWSKQRKPQKKVPNLFSISFGKKGTRPISSQLVKLDLTLSQVRIYFDILSSKKCLHAHDDADVPHYL